jgi:hypothetical protein
MVLSSQATAGEINNKQTMRQWQPSPDEILSSLSTKLTYPTLSWSRSKGGQRLCQGMWLTTSLVCPNNDNHLEEHKDKSPSIAPSLECCKTINGDCSTREGDHKIIGNESQLRTIAVEAMFSVEALKTRKKEAKQNLISECRKLRTK